MRGQVCPSTAPPYYAAPGICLGLALWSRRGPTSRQRRAASGNFGSRIGGVQGPARRDAACAPAGRRPYWRTSPGGRSVRSLHPVATYSRKRVAGMLIASARTTRTWRILVCMEGRGRLARPGVPVCGQAIRAQDLGGLLGQVPAAKSRRGRAIARAGPGPASTRGAGPGVLLLDRQVCERGEGTRDGLFTQNSDSKVRFVAATAWLWNLRERQTPPTEFGCKCNARNSLQIEPWPTFRAPYTSGRRSING